MRILEQLLAGHDFARLNPAAGQMANFAYLDADKETGKESAPFYLSWKTLKLSRYDSLIASFYGSNFIFLFLVFMLFISPLAFAIIFSILVIGYISFAAIRTHTYNRKIVYFPLIIFLTLTRIIGFYFGIIKTAAFKLSARFKR
jgi:hypothetical protein